MKDFGLNLEGFLKIIFLHCEICEFPWFLFWLKILFNVNGKATVWHTPCFFVILGVWRNVKLILNCHMPQKYPLLKKPLFLWLGTFHFRMLKSGLWVNPCYLQGHPLVLPLVGYLTANISKIPPPETTGYLWIPCVLFYFVLLGLGVAVEIWLPGYTTVTK